MVIETLKIIFAKNLDKLKNEVNLYQNEATIWEVGKGISNSAGNLCLHLIGNLNTYIGAELGKTDYIRNRDLEFSARNIPRIELLQKIEETIIVVNTSLDMITEDNLPQEYPMLVFENKTSTGYLLIHLATHLTYHLGQLSYHRRLLDL
ncbi:DinB family protein [Parasediminibacterium sp. JCM 36343]|uniref:DinB family protein n=1 Tax=Parasediminibacterium sp. JCM 36343 TaxID=3374279 RepID=UPI00397824E6